MLAPSRDPLVWVDCEMTGLSPEDVILQVCCYITDSQLKLLDDVGFEVVIHHPQETLDRMDEWCQTTHGSTGLTSRVLASTTNAETAAQLLLEYIKKYIPQPKTALLAGNSVHVDKEFLAREMPGVIEHLHYRILDVSSIKEAARRWCLTDDLGVVPEKKGMHEARMDILESIEEAQFWKGRLFDKNDSKKP